MSLYTIFVYSALPSIHIIANSLLTLFLLNIHSSLTLLLYYTAIILNTAINHSNPLNLKTPSFSSSQNHYISQLLIKPNLLFSRQVIRDNVNSKVEWLISVFSLYYNEVLVKFIHYIYIKGKYIYIYILRINIYIYYFS